jgi:hypothetical protein
MGKTFLGEVAGPEGFSRRVVVKLVRDDLDPAAKQALAEEARLTARLVHRNICPVLDLEQAGDERLVILEYVDGLDLRQLLEREKRLPWPLAAFMAMEVAAGLDYAHRKTDPAGRPLGLVHRDVNPANILLSWEGDVKLADFGVAKLARSDRYSMAGKFGYMAPEQNNGAAVDGRADVFSLGMTLYEAVIGANPLRRRKGGKYPNPPLPRVEREDVPAALSDVIARATCIEPAQRFAGAAAMREALLHIPGLPRDPARQLAQFLHPARIPSGRAREALLALARGAARTVTQVAVGRSDQTRPWGGTRRWILVGVLLLASGGLVWALRSPIRRAVTPSRPKVVVEALRLELPPPAKTSELAVGGSGPLAEAQNDPPVPTALELPEQPQPPPAARPRLRKGTLSVNSIPWANVFVDERPLGHTPRLALSLPAGRHLVRLVAAGGEVRTRKVKVLPGRETKVSVSFSEP